jgi:hypothetical protein
MSVETIHAHLQQYQNKYKKMRHIFLGDDTLKANAKNY